MWIYRPGSYPRQYFSSAVPAGFTEVPAPPSYDPQSHFLGWRGSEWHVEPRPLDDIKAEHRDRVVAIAQPRLAALDAASTRPLRAILSGTAVPDDHDRLAELEASAAAWRMWQGDLSTAIDGAETVVDVLAIDITVGWPE